MRSRRSFVVVATLLLIVAGLPLGLEASDPREETLAAVTPYMSFVGITPCRLVDTRDAGFPAGYGPPLLSAGEYRTIDMSEARCGVPTTARAVSMNVTVVLPSLPGFLSIWPGTSANQPDPLVSSLNYAANDVIPNAVIVPLLDANSQMTVYTPASTHLLIDVNGYFRDTPASEIVNTAAGSIAATTVQAAINELASEKVQASGWTAGRILVTGTSGNITVDNQLQWDDVNDVQTLSSGSFKATGTKGRTIFSGCPSLARTTTAQLTITPDIYGQIVMTRSAAGTANVYIPLPIPTQLYGTAVRLVSVKICYRTSNATTYIDNTNIRTVGDDLVGTEITSLADNQVSTTAACYTVTDDTPGAVPGALVIRLDLTFANLAHSITIGNIEVTLDQI